MKLSAVLFLAASVGLASPVPAGKVKVCCLSIRQARSFTDLCYQDVAARSIKNKVSSNGEMKASAGKKRGWLPSYHNSWVDDDDDWKDSDDDDDWKNWVDLGLGIADTVTDNVHDHIDSRSVENQEVKAPALKKRWFWWPWWHKHHAHWDDYKDWLDDHYDDDDDDDDHKDCGGYWTWWGGASGCVDDDDFYKGKKE